MTALNNVVVGDILKVCDTVRDDVLPNIGVRLEDHEGKRHASFCFSLFVFQLMRC